MNREKIFEKIVLLLKNQGAKKIAVFGSYVKKKKNKELI